MKEICILKKVLLVSLCCLLLASCGKGQEEDGQVGGFSQKLGEDGQVGDSLMLAGTVFGELPVVGEEDPVYCNLPENVRSWENLIPLCLDPLYGILYYVDYGGDYMIHAIYNGESQTVVELPGKRLFCRGGKLYFLLESYNRFGFESAKSGNIAEYDPVTGEVNILTDQTFTSMVVYQDMIYCKSNTGDIIYYEDEEIFIEGQKSWFYFFDTEELVEGETTGDGYVMDFRRYGDYFLAATLEEYEEDPRFSIQTGTELRKWNGERGTVWDGLILMPGSYHYIKEGNFHWMEVDGFHTWNPVSGEDEVSPWISQIWGQYILVGNWLLASNFQLVDIERGEVMDWNTADDRLKVIRELYTDGEEIYVLVGPIIVGDDDDASSLEGCLLRRVQEIEQRNEYCKLWFEALQE